MKRTSALTLCLVAGLAASASAQLAGPSTLQTSYMVPSDASSGVRFISIASNGNGTTTPNETFARLNAAGTPSNYRLVGIPDGMGVFRSAQDIADGTMTILSNHETGATAGIARDHGNRGSFVSVWKVVSNPAAPDFLRVVGAYDLIQTVNLWNVVTSAYESYSGPAGMPLYNSSGTVSSAWTAAGVPVANPNKDGFGRFCSADLAAPTAFKFGNLGTDERIFLNGEEIGAGGRAFAHIVTGPNAGTTWELPQHGKYSWENNVASPFPQAKTVVIGQDDAGGGQIHVWVGNKKATGTEVERAGLIDGKVYAFKVAGTTLESRANVLGTSSVVLNSTFTLADMGDVRNITGAAFQTLGDSLGQMGFARPEDGCWDTVNPNRFYFQTTDATIASGGRSRVWLVEFTDITNPELGGTIRLVLDGAQPALTGTTLVSASGATTIEMLDNLCVTKSGQLLCQEDVGNNSRSGRMWLLDVQANRVTEVGISDRSRFGDSVGVSPALPAVAPFNQDEETSGVIPADDVIAPGWYLLCMQAHYAISGELVEGGQLMAAFVPQTLVGSGCYANCDGSTVAPLLNPGDFICFLNSFRAAQSLPAAQQQSSYANCDGSSVAPVLNPGDFTCFLSRFQGGCR